MNKQICQENRATTLGYGPLSIEVLEGAAWITREKVDMVVKVGERLELEESRFPIVLSSADMDARAVWTVQYGARRALPNVRLTKLFSNMLG